MTQRRQAVAHLHWPLVVVVVALAGMGVYNLHSAAAAHAPGLWRTQLLWCALGLGVAALALVPDYRLGEHVAYLFYALVVGLLVAVLVVGDTRMGARRWLAVGPLRFQPSELAKLAVIACMARYFSTRVPDGGFTIAALARPRNLSRPLALSLLLAASWQRPALIDPVGELARHVARRGGAPEVLDLAWCRAALVVLVLAGALAGLVAIVRWERAAALLHPWPPGRRRRFIGALLLAAAGGAWALAAAWHTPALRDPIGSLLVLLAEAGAPGGRLATVAPSWGLRGALAVGLVAYLGVSVWAWARGGARGPERLVAPLDILLVPALLVLAQPDLGTAAIIFFIGMTMVLVVGVRPKSLVTLVGLGCLVSAILWFGALKDYQKRRILTFIDPEHDLQGAGWNAVQSLIAVGSGRWAGKGHLGGTQTQLSFLPEQHTDFAFSVWAEEQGFVGSTFLLALFALLLWLAFGVAKEARDTFGALLACGMAALVMWQVVVNVGMVIGVLPVVGITLPLFSYGGSSTLGVMLGLGALVNVHWRRRVA